MGTLTTGKEKIQTICDALRKETLEPAQQEAREIIENAHLQAQEIILDAQKKAEQIAAAEQKEAAERQKIFASSLQMASRQGIEQLKQTIEKEFFNREMVDLLKEKMGDPELIAKILTSFMKMVEERGIDDELTAVIPKSISPRSVSILLGARVLERLQQENIEIGDFSGGVHIRLKNRQITIDISDGAVRELIIRYIRRDFRDLIFAV